MRVKHILGGFWVALITCRPCGKEISDKAKVCPACGRPIEEKGEKEIPQKVETIAVHIPIKWLTRTFPTLVTAIVIVIFGIKIYHQEQMANFQNNYNLAAITMSESAEKAKDTGNLIKRVWYNTLHKKHDTRTDRYTGTRDEKGKFTFEDDLNIPLSRLFGDENFKSQISEIEETQTSVFYLMKEVINPPSEKEEAYQAIKKLYDSYLAFTDLVISPSGSYKTFSSSFNTLSAEVSNSFHALNLYLS